MAENADLLWVNTGLRLKKTNRCEIVVGQSFIGDCLPVPCRLPSTSFIEHERGYAASGEAIREKERRSPSGFGTASVQKNDSGVCAGAVRAQQRTGKNDIPDSERNVFPLVRWWI